MVAAVLPKACARAHGTVIALVILTARRKANDCRSGLAAHDAIDGTNTVRSLRDSAGYRARRGIGGAAERWPFFDPLRIGRRPVEASRPRPPE